MEVNMKLITAASPHDLNAQVQVALKMDYDLYQFTVVSRGMDDGGSLTQWMAKGRANHEYSLVAMLDADSMVAEVNRLVEDGWFLYGNHFFFGIYTCQWMERFALDKRPETVQRAAYQTESYASPLPWP